MSIHFTVAWEVSSKHLVLFPTVFCSTGQSIVPGVSYADITFAWLFFGITFRWKNNSLKVKP